MNSISDIIVSCSDEDMRQVTLTSTSLDTSFYHFMADMRRRLDVPVDQRLRLHWTTTTGDLNTLATPVDFAEAKRASQRAAGSYAGHHRHPMVEIRQVMIIKAHRETMLPFTPVNRLPPISEMVADCDCTVGCCEVCADRGDAPVVVSATAEELVPLLPTPSLPGQVMDTDKSDCCGVHYVTRLALADESLSRSRVRLGPTAADAERELLLPSTAMTATDGSSIVALCMDEMCQCGNSSGTSTRTVGIDAAPTAFPCGTQTAPILSESVAVNTDSSRCVDAAVQHDHQLISVHTSMYDDVNGIETVEREEWSWTAAYEDDDDKTVVAESSPDAQWRHYYPSPPASVTDDKQRSVEVVEMAGRVPTARQKVALPFLPMATPPGSLTVSLRMPAGDSDAWPSTHDDDSEDFLQADEDTADSQQEEVEQEADSKQVQQKDQQLHQVTLTPSSPQWLDDEEFEVVVSDGGESAAMHLYSF